MTRPKPTAKSLANLRPWKPGFSPNPNGRRAGFTYVSEWINALLIVKEDGTSKYRKSDLEKIVAQEDPGVSKAIAAQWLLNCMKSGECFVTGKDGEILPARLDAEPGRERERLMDRTEGKPAVTITHRQEPLPEITDLQERLSAMLEAHPGLRALLPQGSDQVDTSGHVLGGKSKESDEIVIDPELQEFKADETSE